MIATLDHELDPELLAPARDDGGSSSAKARPICPPCPICGSNGAVVGPVPVDVAGSLDVVLNYSCKSCRTTFTTAYSRK